MPRRPRYLPAGMPVHVVQRGNNRQVCFTSDKDLAAYAAWLYEAAEKYDMAIHAWVFMTNHIHLLVTPGSDNAISKCMQYLGRYYVRYFNFHYTRTGTLFEGRFKASLVQSSHYLLACCRYIELNPVRAGIVADPADYVWSSYRANAFGQQVKMWTAHNEYLSLGRTSEDRQKTYQQLFFEEIGEALITDIRHAVNTGFVLGNDRFRAEVERLTGLPQSYQKRGPKFRSSDD